MSYNFSKVGAFDKVGGMIQSRGVTTLLHTMGKDEIEYGWNGYSMYWNSNWDPNFDLIVLEVFCHLVSKLIIFPSIFYYDIFYFCRALG